MPRFIDGLKYYKERFTGRELIRQISLARTVRRLEPFATLAYSLAGEDLCLRSFFRQQSKGYYVDVGCSLPKHISNTFHFYRSGWNGLALDANGDLADEWKKIRPRDVFVHAALSDEPMEVQYKKYSSSEFNTISPAGASEPLSGGPGPQLLETIPMMTRTLTDIFEEYKVPEQFEFMNVDVEGLDLQVLRSLDFDRWRPKMICIETHDFDPLRPTDSPLVTFCEAAGYDFCGYLKLNAFFSRKP